METLFYGTGWSTGSERDEKIALIAAGEWRNLLLPPVIKSILRHRKVGFHIDGGGLVLAVPETGPMTWEKWGKASEPVNPRVIGDATLMNVKEARDIAFDRTKVDEIKEEPPYVPWAEAPVVGSIASMKAPPWLREAAKDSELTSHMLAATAVDRAQRAIFTGTEPFTALRNALAELLDEINNEASK